MERIEKMTELQDKQRFWPLLLLADPEEDMVMKYLPDGEMFVLFADGVAACEAVTHVRADGQMELKNLATDPGFQRRGYAGRMIAHLVSEYRGRYAWLYVGTAFPGLYEQWGFEYAYTEEEFFTRNYPEPVIDEGRLCVDMIYYRKRIEE